MALGSSNGVLPALAGLDALRRLVDKRNDMTTPLVSAGGPSGAWLAALAQPQNGTPVHSPSMHTLYTGDDPAAHLASGATLPRPPAGLRAPGSRNLPPGFAALIAPATQPAIPFAWESLPLRTLESAPPSAPPSALPPGAGQAGLLGAGRWGGWLGLALAALLIVGSILM
jgi:hypothetical protein